MVLPGQSSRRSLSASSTAAIKSCTVEISSETPEISDLSEPKERISDVPEDSDVI